MWLWKVSRSWYIKIAKKDDLAHLTSAIDKLETVPSNLNSLKSKVDKLDVDKFKSVHVD